MITFDNKCILITGAAGFVGSTLSKYLAKKYELILLDDLSYGSLDNLIDYEVSQSDHLSSTLIECDITDIQLMLSLLKDKRIDYVIHCAAIAPLADCQNNPSRAMEVNLNGWINILEISRELGVKKCVFSQHKCLI